MLGTTISDPKSVIVYVLILLANALIYIFAKPDMKPRWRHDISGVIVLCVVILIMWFVPAQLGKYDTCNANYTNCNNTPPWFLRSDSLWLYTLFSGLVATSLWALIKECWERIDDLWSSLKPRVPKKPGA